MQSRFEKLLREEISLMKDMITHVMTGPGFGDYAQYQYNLGLIHAYNRVLDAMEKVKDDMGKE